MRTAVCFLIELIYRASKKKKKKKKKNRIKKFEEEEFRTFTNLLSLYDEEFYFREHAALKDSSNPNSTERILYLIPTRARSIY